MAANGEAGAGGLRRLALHDRHEALGARFAPFAGWEMHLSYEGVVAEHEAVRARAGVFDVSHLARAWVRGPGAGARLRAATTFGVTSMAEGTAHYSLYCNAAGGIEDDVFVYRLPGERWLVVHNAANAEADFARLRAAAGDAAAEETRDTAMLAVQGPAAPALLADVLGDGYAALAPRGCAELEWRGAPVLAARTGYTGEDGGECVVRAEDAATLWDALIEAGAAPCGLGARDTLRLEAALPLHGADIDVATHPYEAGLGFAVSLGDGADFEGRAALAEARARPLARRLACIAARGRGVPRAGHAVHAADGGGGLAGPPLARLTSGAWSPTLRHGVGMAYLPLELTEPGALLAVDVRGRALPAEVVRRPFYRKPKQP